MRVMKKLLKQEDNFFASLGAAGTLGERVLLPDFQSRKYSLRTLWVSGHHLCHQAIAAGTASGICLRAKGDLL